MQSDEPLVSTLREWVEVFMRLSMRNFIAFARDQGLSMSQIGALFHIFHGKCSVSEISEFLGVSNAASSQLLERLVQQGLVLRTEDPHDRRYKQIVLTDQGRSIIKQSITIRYEWLEQLAQTLTEDERQQVLSALEILVAKSSQFEEQAEAV